MKVKLTGARDGVTVVAALLAEEAPRTCERIWSELPLEGELHHAIWSGPETYLLIDPAIRIGPEHQTVHPLPGEIGYYTLEGGQQIGWPDDISEIAFFYGRGARPSMPNGPVAVNLFARIVENLDGFAAFCGRIKREGLKSLRVEKL